MPDNYIPHDLLLGGKFSDMAEIRIKKRQATIVKIKDETEEAASNGTTTAVDWKEVLAVNIEFDNHKPEDKLLSDITEPRIREELKKMVDDYESTKV